MNKYNLLIAFIGFYFFFLNGKIKAIINLYGIILGGISIISSVVVFFYNAFFNVHRDDGGDLTNLFGVLLAGGFISCLFFSIMTATSRYAWENRDSSNDVSKFRILNGTCMYCKKEVSRAALKCPYCHSDLK